MVTLLMFYGVNKTFCQTFEKVSTLRLTGTLYRSGGFMYGFSSSLSPGVVSNLWWQVSES